MTLTSTPTPKPPVSIIVADDNLAYRNGLSNLLNQMSAFYVVAEVSNGLELISSCHIHKPHLVLTDIKMPLVDGLSAARTLSEIYPEMRILTMSMYNQVSIWKELTTSGAHGFVLKDIEFGSLVATIDKILNNQTHFENSELNGGNQIRDESLSLVSRQINFTPKELAIIRLSCEEKCAKEIAARLNSTKKAVDATRERIRDKIGARSLVGIVTYAIRHQIFQL
jgi:DNA-binding NarL/FixJ family response regulator